MKPFGGITVAVVLNTGEVVRLARENCEPDEIKRILADFAVAVEVGSGLSGITEGGDYVEIPSRSVLYIRGLLT